MTTARVARLEELPPGSVRRVDAGGTPVVLTRVDDAVYACGEACAHRGGPLGEGRLRGARLVCPWHGWMFDVRTGECTFPGRGASVPSYPVEIRDGEVWVRTP